MPKKILRNNQIVKKKYEIQWKMKSELILCCPSSSFSDRLHSPGPEFNLFKTILNNQIKKSSLLLVYLLLKKL